MGGGGGGGGGGPAASGGGSSSEDDGDAAWKAAIDSIASVGFGVPSSNGVAKAASGGSGEADTDAELEQPHEGKPQAPRLKLYQIKVTFVCFYAKFANPVFRLFRGGIESCTILCSCRFVQKKKNPVPFSKLGVCSGLTRTHFPVCLID